MSVFFKDFRQHTNKKCVKLLTIEKKLKCIWRTYWMPFLFILNYPHHLIQQKLSIRQCLRKNGTGQMTPWLRILLLFQRSCSQHTYCLKHQLQGDPEPSSGLHRQLLSHTHSYTDTRHTHNLEQTIKYDWHVLYIDIFFLFYLWMIAYVPEECWSWLKF